MHANNRDLHNLAYRALRGDRQAGADLHRELEPHWVNIVRQALRNVGTGNPITKRVLAEAKQVVADGCRPESECPEHMICLIARRLSESVRTFATGESGGIRQWHQDTVPTA